MRCLTVFVLMLISQSAGAQFTEHNISIDALSASYLYSSDNAKVEGNSWVGVDVNRQSEVTYLVTFDEPIAEAYCQGLVDAESFSENIHNFIQFAASGTNVHFQTFSVFSLGTPTNTFWKEITFSPEVFWGKQIFIRTRFLGPSTKFDGLNLRVATVPEHSTLLLALIGCSFFWPRGRSDATKPSRLATRRCQRSSSKGGPRSL